MSQIKVDSRALRSLTDLLGRQREQIPEDTEWHGVLPALEGTGDLLLQMDTMGAAVTLFWPGVARNYLFDCFAGGEPETDTEAFQ